MGAEAVGLDDIYDVDADVFSPCALGAVVNENTIPRFKFKVVAGAANNQLANNEAGDELEQRGILYAPDYAVNAGGLMNVSIEFEGYSEERAYRMTRMIYYNLTRSSKSPSATIFPPSGPPTAWPKNASPFSAKSKCRTWANRTASPGANAAHA